MSDYRLRNCIVSTNNKEKSACKPITCKALAALKISSQISTGHYFGLGCLTRGKQADSGHGRFSPGTHRTSRVAKLNRSVEMSAATKRKHVVKEVLDDFVLPEGNQQIVRISAGRGNNLHEVETENNEKFLVSMPTKFRKNVWIKRGDFVIIEPIDEGDKVKAEIVYILYKDQVKYIKEEGKWPAGFSDDSDNKNSNSMIPDDMLPPSDSDSENEENLGDKVINTNRPTVTYEESESSDEDEND
ncbi:probable RNA-binding protein EIF1AD isoform X1 [Mercenaria mercenaria]|uniref:probable RNA-binding protein EIF1AD isoform X1 n=2 Tax=Mercenaria mercenaria TaxID=6596 RepID=UPI00234E9F31|nr:probable RNA-binding protein EIF1AD isoform X1 [Mercenaria mercenaria]